MPVGEGGGDGSDEERLLRLRDADVEVVVPGDEAAVPDQCPPRPFWYPYIFVLRMSGFLGC